jgi:serine/threonine protein kinase
VHRLENEPMTSPGFPVLCAADIYSTGCCIAEVFNEGEPTLTFSDILSLATHLRKNTDLSNQHVFPSDTMLHRVLPSRGGSSTWYLPQYCLSNLEDKRVRELVLWMCHPSVKERPTAIECLIKGREMALFPESFFSFLLPFTTLMLHPLLQSNHVVSFFMKKTLKNFEKDSKALSNILNSFKK